MAVNQMYYFIDQMTHSQFVCVCVCRVVMMLQLQVNELDFIQICNVEHEKNPPGLLILHLSLQCRGLDSSLHVNSKFI